MAFGSPVPKLLRNRLTSACFAALPHSCASVGTFCTSSSTGSDALPLDVPSVCVWGANTGVGKTLVSAGLTLAALRSGKDVLYLKPVQTGYPVDSDSRLVASACAGSGSSNRAKLTSRVLFHYQQAVGPHLAAAQEGRVVSDEDVVAATRSKLQAFASRQRARCSSNGRATAFALVETAGGVASPGPSGTLQADLFRPLRLPALLVGDAALGGISTTLTAYDSLLFRGHDTVALVMMRDARLGNIDAISQHLKGAAAHRMGQPLPIVGLPMCKPPPSALPELTGADADQVAPLDEHLLEWLEESKAGFDELLQAVLAAHAEHTGWLATAGEAARRSVWWPFTQHASLPNGAVTVVDARAGESWMTYSQGPQDGTALVPLRDGCASWWTQTVRGDLQPEVVRALGAAAGRYMHVMWPELAHEPGLRLIQALLTGPLGAGWASRVFFSDDGSTGVEVALKMAFRTFLVTHGLLGTEAAADESAEGADGGSSSMPVLQVLALQNSYHGDTLGAMDCAAASPFNGPLQTPWYTGRGLFLQPPYVGLSRGAWRVDLPSWLAERDGGNGCSTGAAHLASVGWATRNAVFSPERDSEPLYDLYARAIDDAITTHERSSGAHLGALLMEPVLQGAGGMLMVDPSFQRALVRACRQRRIPIIYDEVFTGAWRLGAPSGASLLRERPDIAVYAKLLTGGVAPLAATLATETVFDAFKGPTKLQALLHGHSFTAYPLGCAAALAGLQLLQSSDANPNVCTPHVPGRCRASPVCEGPCGELLQQWSEEAAALLSCHSAVQRVVALGSVLAVEVRHMRGSSDVSSGAASYTACSAAGVIAALRRRGVFARPLGGVVYLMVTPTTSRKDCQHLLDQVRDAVEEAAASDGGSYASLVGVEQLLALP